MSTRTRSAMLVSFRDADRPRALGGPLLAAARQTDAGWALNLFGTDTTTEHVTFESAAELAGRLTGVTRLLIVWTRA